MEKKSSEQIAFHPNDQAPEKTEEVRENKLAPHLGKGPSLETLARLNSAYGENGHVYTSQYATPDSSALRRVNDARDIASPLRPAFLRDIEKIMHTPAFNRLAGKTQVFSFRANDDLTRRGLHVQLVSRVARDIGSALGLNTDLIEAIALGHDIGHTPFGHAGETFLNNVYHERTGRWFFHNVHSVRVLDTLYGRNLTLQTLDGILAHNGEYEAAHFSTSNLSTFEEFDEIVERCIATGEGAIGKIRPMTLEGCVVRISDIIAYVGKDRQDAVRALKVGKDTFADGLGSYYNSWALDAFIADIVENSLGKGEISMSKAAFEELRRAKKENGEKIYFANEVGKETRVTIAPLFEMVYDAAYEDLKEGLSNSPIMAHSIRPIQEALSHYGRTYDWEADFDQTVVDFIASMTDDYFIAYVEHLDKEAAKLFPHRGYFDNLLEAN